jgi:ABC-2 type transport system ATP-binding protein
LLLTLAEDFSPADLNRVLFQQGIVLAELSRRQKTLESQFLDIIHQNNSL